MMILRIWNISSKEQVGLSVDFEPLFNKAAFTDTEREFTFLHTVANSHVHPVRS
jgi:hypothetical protein